jgi:hypothetical protein
LFNQVGHEKLPTQLCIDHNDVLVVDRSLSLKNNQVFLINTNAEFLIRRCDIIILDCQQKITFHHYNQSVMEEMLEANEEGDIWSLVWLPLF